MITPFHLAIQVRDIEEARELKRLENHFGQADKKEENVRKKIERHFEDTPYRFEVSNVAIKGMPQEGEITLEDLTAIKFSIMIWVEGAEILAKAEEVDRGLREIFPPEEIEQMTIYYGTGMDGGVRIIKTLDSMRGTERFWKEQGGRPSAVDGKGPNQ